MRSVLLRHKPAGKEKKMASKERIFQLIKDFGQKSSEGNAAYAIHMCRRFFTVLGVWPPMNDRILTWRIVLANISVTVCYFGIAIRSLPTLLHVIIDQKNNVAKIRDLARVWFVLIEGMKYYLLRSHRRDIEMCIRHIERDWLETDTPSYQKIMLQHARYGHLVTRICFFASFSAATWYAMLPFVVKRHNSNTARGNATGIVSTRSFAVPSHFGVSFVNESPIYEIIYSYQVIATFILHSIGVACYSLTAVIVVHACGQLKILMAKLGELVNGGGDSKMRSSVDCRMANIIEHHVRSLKFVSSAEKMLRGICLVSVGGYTLLLCVVGYLIYLEARTEPRNLVALMSFISLYTTFMFNIFSFCYIGELLTQECTKVGEVTYMIDWYRLPGKQPLGLTLVITMAHAPVTLTAGGAIQLSMRCFASIVRTSFGYLNMLRTMID